uniref:Uncharacterized protein n=1 Tax=Trichogramma kaykai TaxID=54128 RepID=A0ABD2XFR4_9HYME
MKSFPCRMYVGICADFTFKISTHVHAYIHGHDIDIWSCRLTSEDEKKSISSTRWHCGAAAAAASKTSRKMPSTQARERSVRICNTPSMLPGGLTYIRLIPDEQYGKKHGIVRLRFESSV